MTKPEATDPLALLWEANHEPPGFGPMLKVIDRYGHVTGYKRARDGLKTSAGVVLRTRSESFWTIQDGSCVEMLHRTARGGLPVIQLA
jgi:hypothetical protein